jgi:hypothetical protein
VRTVATVETLERVRGRGGAVYVRARAVRCCGGRGWTLEASSSAPDIRVELIDEPDGVKVFAPVGFVRPDELQLEFARGGALQAYWNNQAWIG